MSDPYEKIYTLAVPFTDTLHSIMNGHIIRIRKDKYDHLRFFDAISGEGLIDSTKVVEKVESDDGYVTIATESGTVYVLRRISYLLPTKLRNDPEDVPEPAPEPSSDTSDPDPVEAFNFQVLDEKHNSKPIKYGDGYDEIVFTFDRDLTEDEFRSFCTHRNLALKPKGAWWENYNVVMGEGARWTWRYVRVYTD